MIGLRMEIVSMNEDRTMMTCRLLEGPRIGELVHVRITKFEATVEDGEFTLDIEGDVFEGTN